MKTYPKSPLPPNLKSIPNGYVYLGKGGEFQHLPNMASFLGYCMKSDDRFNSGASDGTLPKDWIGVTRSYYYFAPADSEIARLNGLGPRKRKVAPKVRYFTNPSGFSGDVAYVRHDGNPAENVISVFKDGREARSPQVDLDFSLDACKRGVWKELSEKEALALVKPAPKPVPVVSPVPPPSKKATITDLWEAFIAYTKSGNGLHSLHFYDDESGFVRKSFDEILFKFGNQNGGFTGAVKWLKANTK